MLQKVNWENFLLHEMEMNSNLQHKAGYKNRRFVRTYKGEIRNVALLYFLKIKRTTLFIDTFSILSL